MVGPKWNRVTIIGCGLIGASFALALKRSGMCERIAGWDTSQDALSGALARGVIDEVDRSFANGAISPSDLIYLAMPVSDIIRFLKECGWQVKRHALITDAGSTKAEVCSAAQEYLPAERCFVGGHPIAGSQHAGLEHACAELFKGAAYVLITAQEKDDEERALLGQLKLTLELLGARVSTMTASEHDRALALVSHLPQLMAGALAATIESQPDAQDLLDLSGSGYRDMTRLAGSSWRIWRDILATNPTRIVASLNMAIERLTLLRDELEAYAGGMSQELEAARALFGSGANGSRRGPSS
jgi:prephenate dehydrogenase